MTVGRIDGLAAALEVQLAVVRQLAEVDLTLESACPGWSVREVLRHSLGVTEKFTEFASGRSDRPRTPSGNLLVPDHRTGAERAVRRSHLAWTGADLGRTCHLPFGDFRAEDAAGINLFDVLAHTSDIAVVIDVELSCPDELWDAGRHAAGAVLGRGRDGRHYLPEVPVAAGASPKARFLAYLGRTPSDPCNARTPEPTHPTRTS